MNKVRKLFKDLPFNVVYANTDIETKHLLQILKKHINEADYSIFDLSSWNPNVTLELGLSEGIRKISNKKYYILLNTKRALEVPADIRGIQRLEYSRYDYSIDKGLGDCLITILKSEAWVKNIHLGLKRKLGDESKIEKALYLSLRIIAHMRDFEKLTPDNLKSLSRGTRLREEVRKKNTRVSPGSRFYTKGTKIKCVL
ncbi:hypothetical protein BU251_07045 [Candidatus Velamenicoccus archaeovorus]|uniref:Uncharacterized protein n=1 Tax=Velamenicoccus archaeovorus TaxID=1930593 RepID=A0A410P5L8_VELA1|nr:hypothetical protein BU251_07045 [Candidatus Velamenicoccus archaeovorus]